MAEEEQAEIVEVAVKASETSIAEELSVQKRFESGEVGDLGYLGGLWWFVSSATEDIPPWWSPQRDRDLRKFWMRRGNDILQGAVSSMVKKFKAMNWVLEGPERVVNHYQEVLAESEDRAGWGTLLGKTLTDYLTQDAGGFWELIGKGKPDKPIEGRVLGLAHLDAGRCQLTGDPVYPVLYASPKTGLSHKLHATRVVHMVDMPSPREEMNNVGFSAVSRVVASSQILLKLAQYKDEKLDDLPQAGLLLLNNIMPSQWDDIKAQHEKGRRKVGHELWSSVMTLIGLDPAQPTTAEFISFAGLPDNFDERSATDIYVNVVALAFGVDVREFWPLSAGALGTAAETLIQHQKARGKGVGDLVSTLERAVNWKVLPASVSFRFDFRDDEEDAQRADIQDRRTRTIMEMWEKPKFDDPQQPVVTRLEIRQMLADNVDYFKDDFLIIDVTEETQATDTEREKMLKSFGPIVAVDRFGNQLGMGHKLLRHAWVDDVLAVVESNYRAGLIEAGDLAEFALGELLDRKEDVSR